MGRTKVGRAKWAERKWAEKRGRRRKQQTKGSEKGAKGTERGETGERIGEGDVRAWAETGGDCWQDVCLRGELPDSQRELQRACRRHGRLAMAIVEIRL